MESNQSSGGNDRVRGAARRPAIYLSMVSNGGAVRKRAAGPTDQSGVIAAARQPACRTERDIRAGAGAFQLIFKGLQQKERCFKMPEEKKNLWERFASKFVDNYTSNILLERGKDLKEVLYFFFLPPLFPHHERHTATGNVWEWQRGLGAGSHHNKGKLWVRGVGKSPTGAPSQCDLH